MTYSYTDRGQVERWSTGPGRPPTPTTRSAGSQKSRTATATSSTTATTSPTTKPPSPTPAATQSPAPTTTTTVSSIADWLSNTTSFSYDADGNLTATAFPGSVDQTDNYLYDNQDGLAANTTTTGSGTLASFDYTYDPNGNLTQQAVLNPTPATQTNSYNSLGQLTANNTSNYNYDADGNPTQLPGSSTPLAYDAADQLTSGPQGTYTYNDLGQRTQLTAGATNTTWGWDQAGNLTSNTGGTSSLNLSYGYDGNGLLQARTNGATTTQLTWDPTASIPQLVVDDGTNIIYGPDRSHSNRSTERPSTTTTTTNSDPRASSPTPPDRLSRPSTTRHTERQQSPAAPHPPVSCTPANTPTPTAGWFICRRGGTTPPAGNSCR